MLFTNFLVYATIAVTASAAPFNSTLGKRDGNTCQFPKGKGLIAITSDKDNGGWAMSPDQKCTSGNYCPYACPSGKLMAQWDTKATSYKYPESQNGGLKCNSDGTVSKPFSDKDYCVDGEGTVKAKNSAKDQVAFCQTVLPGNEDMLIPTKVGGGSLEDLAVPGPDYYAGTAAHYYVNPPGVSTDDACSWGSKDKSQGNWSPYVAGANMDDNGQTFVKIGWNPKYVEDFDNKKPDFGIRVTCDDEGDCNGLDCEIDPSSTGFNGVKGSDSGKQQGASYCIVTAKNKASAKIEVFSKDN
ncbi:hypothetical protein QCA50_009868 [Cerrena zonata]|uniref:Uncharacterized protein n=1 Tax=Cerrena zonata TaxID=2478898 RepID=A0AAW0G0P0_9APHY